MLEVVEFEVIERQLVPACTGQDEFGVVSVNDILPPFPSIGGSAYANGQIPVSALKPIAGGGYLEPAAAAAWNAMAAHIFAQTGQRISPNGPDSSYRPYARQVYWRNYWCGQGNCANAAIPGTSNHGWGLAVDTWAQALIAQYGAAFGWQKAWSDASWEPWHFRYQPGHYSGADPGPGYSGPGAVDHYPTLKKGDTGEAVKRAQKHLRRWNQGLIRPEVDGGFGENTADAVRQFQTVHGLGVDGAIGPKSWRELRRKRKLYADEQSHVNRIRWMRSTGGNDKDRDAFRALRDWCAKRAESIKQVAEGGAGWKGQDREYRFKVLKAAAGDQF